MSGVSGASVRIAYQGTSESVDASSRPTGDFTSPFTVGAKTVFVTAADLVKLRALQGEDTVTMEVRPDAGYLERFLLGDLHGENPEAIGRGPLAGLEPPASKGAGLRKK